MNHKLMAVAASAVMALGFGTTEVSAATGDTLKTVMDRGELLCPGHNGSFKGFAEVDDKGNWIGLDIDICRALATAIFGTPDKLQIIPISWAQRFPSLQSGDLDVIIKVTGWTLGRDTEQALQFSRPYFIGTTQLLARKSLGTKSLAELNGAAICLTVGTSTEKLVVDRLESVGIEYEIVGFEKTEEMRAAYFSGRCDVMTGWGPSLAIRRAGAENPDDHIIMDDVLDLEAESIVVRQGDDNWVDIMNWLLSALMTAEVQGITSANVDEHKANPANPTVERLLGVSPGVGSRLGLSDDWVYNVIKHVGNMAEIYDRALGKDSAYGLPRGVNALYTEGGVMFPLLFD